jgi:predicted lipoprotein with Yx(FWY)xxD motif
MRHLALIGLMPLVCGLMIAGCNGQPGTDRESRSNDTVATTPIAAVPPDRGAGDSASGSPDPGQPRQIAPGAMPDVPVAVQIIAENGNYVLRTNKDDKPLYSYDRDGLGQSSCTDGCAAAWPPLATPAGAKPVGDWSVVIRADGSRQWAYRGKPVYTYARDAEAVPSGDGKDGAWHLLPAIRVK